MHRTVSYLWLMALAFAPCCGNGADPADADSEADPDAVPDPPGDPDGAESDADDGVDPWDGPDGEEDPPDEDVPVPVTWYVDDIDDGREGSGTREDPFRSLQTAVDAAAGGDSIFVSNGRYYAEAFSTIDPTCGNCADADFRAHIPITVGFHVMDKELHIGGESRSGTELYTGAGYGIYFENAGASSLENLSIRGGVRDGDGRATDAGIVVKYTTLTVRDVDVVENDNLFTGDPDPVVGIMGIAGREGAELAVSGCRIHDNSWDGIALYRSDPDVPGSGASALIVNNSIGCNTGCVNPRGRGVGIGITWDARAEIIRNRIFSYWKGIGSFGTSTVVVKNNIVINQHGWGVATADESHMEAVNNVIAFNGTAGLSAWSSTVTGAYINNIIVGNGQNPDEWVGKRTGLWMNATSDRVTLAYNDIWNNQLEDACMGGIPGGAPCTPLTFEGIDGNLSVDPLFADAASFALGTGSPLIDAGDPSILDVDGTRSDMGAHGGPDADREEP